LTDVTLQPLLPLSLAVQSVTAETPKDTVAGELVDRARALAVVGPLVKLLASNLSGPVGLLDTYTLAMGAIGHIIDGLRLMNLTESSLTAPALCSQIAVDIGKQFTALVEKGKLDRLPPSDEVKEIAELIVDQLLARRYRGTFTEDLFVPGAGFERFEFQLVEQYDNPEGELLIRPTAACTNLYLNALGQPLSDMQVALAAIIDRQISRGDFAMAEKTAMQHRHLTHQHLLEVRMLNRRIESNVRQISWAEQLRPELERFADEIPPLIKNDEQLHDTLAGNIDALTGPKGLLAKRVLVIIRECRDTYRQIWVIAGDLRRSFSNAMVRHGLFTRQSTLPSLEDAVLRPALMLPDLVALDLAEQGLIAAMCGVRQPVVEDLRFVLERLLMPRQEANEVLDETLLPPNLVAFDAQVNSLFSRDVLTSAWEMISNLPQAGVLLSELIAQAEGGPAPVDASHLLGLFVVRAWADRSDDTFVATKTGNRFICRHASGDDFRLTEPGLQKNQDQKGDS